MHLNKIVQFLQIYIHIYLKTFCTAFTQIELVSNEKTVQCFKCFRRSNFCFSSWFVQNSTICNFPVNLIWLRWYIGSLTLHAYGNTFDTNERMNALYFFINMIIYNDSNIHPNFYQADVLMFCCIPSSFVFH